MPNIKSVLCLSGGADSATLAFLAVAQSCEAHAITIDYGQRHSKEIECAKKLAENLKIPHEIISFDVLKLFGGSPLVDDKLVIPGYVENLQATTVVPYRNTFIATIAAAYAEKHGLNSIYMGVTHEDLANYEDCRPLFFESLQTTLRLAGRIPDLMIRTPFIDMYKSQIVKLGYDNYGVPYEDTWTCYVGKERPCLQCDACCERAQAFFDAGIAKDPLLTDEEWAIWCANNLDVSN